MSVMQNLTKPEYTIILIMEENRRYCSRSGSVDEDITQDPIRTDSGKEINLVRCENVKNIMEYIDRSMNDRTKRRMVMALKKKPVTGMKDMMPAEMEVRDYVIGLIKETYKTFGFSSMETPCVEHIENLCSKQGGDNEKLIFKILKRGEKLKLDTAKEEADLVDGGLRYDLTVPLSRYYANHANELPSPFKALQMGNVWRADRPQRGRFVSSCSAISIFSENRRIWQRSN